MELADIVASIESSGNQYAQRFERLHLGVTNAATVNAIMKANHVSYSTADVYASMSHGLFQIMGFRLYSDKANDKRNLGFADPLWKFLTNKELQISYFKLYCARSGILYTAEQLEFDPLAREKFATEYNGPGNVVAYSGKMLETIAMLHHVGQ